MAAVALRFAEVLTSHPDARALLARFHAEIRARFGFDLSRQASLEDLEPPGGRFLVAYDGDRPVACGGFRTWEPGVCEMKRMYVEPDARRHGHGRALLAALEETARASGFRRCVLDTLDSHVDANRFYDTTHYERVEAYNENPYASAWFAKNL
ncbi:MAG TPA: GNAT family N-acetyltransferase [Polyangiaceae bacterium]